MFCASFVTEKLDVSPNSACYLNTYLFLSIFSSLSKEKRKRKKLMKRMEFSCKFWENPFVKSLRVFGVELHCGWHCFRAACVVVSPLTAFSWESRLRKTANATTKNSAKPYMQRKHKHLSRNTLNYKPNIFPKQNLSCLIRLKGKQNIPFIWQWP